MTRRSSRCTRHANSVPRACHTEHVRPFKPKVSHMFRFPSYTCHYLPLHLGLILQLRVPLNGIVVGLDILASLDHSPIADRDPKLAMYDIVRPPATATAAAAAAAAVDRRAVVQSMRGAASSMTSLVSDFLALESARVRKH